MFLFHLLILLHQRCIGMARLFFSSWNFHLRILLGCRSWRNRVRCRRLNAFGIIQFQIQAQVQRLVECLTQVLCNAIDTSVMVVHDSRFAILVIANLGVGAYNILRKRLKELVAWHFCTPVNYRLNEKLFISRQRLLFGVLLENNQVRADICSSIFAERIVGQTQSRHKVSLFHKLHSYERRSGVHYTLRCDKGNQASFSHLVKTFEKEVIVQRLGSLTIANLLANGISRVCNREISERNIGGSNIKVTVEVTLNLLEPLYACQH